MDLHAAMRLNAFLTRTKPKNVTSRVSAAVRDAVQGHKARRQ
jgi:hypothetical protein